MELRTRIGVNTGEVVVGDASAGQALVVGDSVILAARLEQTARSGEILLGPATYAAVRDHVEAEPTGALELKGLREPVVAYRLAAVEAGSSEDDRPDPPLVDRASELDAIRSAFRRSAETHGCTMLTILGSAGVGKSRLSREFESALSEEALVLRARCLPYGDGITFWPVAELVSQACAITNDDSREQARAKIESVLRGRGRGVAHRRARRRRDGIAPETTGLQETFWAIRRFLEWLGRDRPLVVVVDDLQWAEPTFLDLVEYLAGWCRDVALLLLGLARPDLMDVRPAWGGGTANAGSLRLAPLGDEDSEELLQRLLAGARLDERATERITESAGGNPLFLEEMLRMLEDDGLLRRGEEGAGGVLDLSGVAVPASIHAVLGARLDRLSAEERAVIRCASVVGKVFWWGAVSELAPEGVRPSVGSHLQTLVRKDLIRPERSTFSGEDAFRFHHILIQEAAYLGTPKEIRAELHERFAGWLERTAGERLTEYEEVLGYHLERAYRYRVELGSAGPGEIELAQRAGRLLASAGRRAFGRGDMAAAADLLSRSAALLPAEHPERRALLPDLGEALSEAGDLAQAEAVLVEAAELAARADDPGLRAHALIVGMLVLESTDPKRTSGRGRRPGRGADPRPGGPARRGGPRACPPPAGRHALGAGPVRGRAGGLRAVRGARPAGRRPLGGERGARRDPGVRRLRPRPGVRGRAAVRGDPGRRARGRLAGGGRAAGAGLGPRDAGAVRRGPRARRAGRGRSSRSSGCAFAPCSWRRRSARSRSSRGTSPPPSASTGPGTTPRRSSGSAGSCRRSPPRSPTCSSRAGGSRTPRCSPA